MNQHHPDRQRNTTSTTNHRPPHHQHQGSAEVHADYMLTLQVRGGGPFANPSNSAWWLLTWSRICPAQHLDRLKGSGGIDPRSQRGWLGSSRFPRPDLLNVSAGQDPGSPVPGCVRAYCGGVGPVDGGVCRMYIRVMGVDGVGRKRCPRCGKSLRLEAFARNRGRRDGRGVYCRECEAVRWRQREARRRQQGWPSRSRRAKGRTLDELLSEW